MKNFLRVLLVGIGIFFLFGGVLASGNGTDLVNKGETFNLNTLFVNKVNGKDTKESKIHNFKSAIGAIVKMITGVIGGFAVLGTILGGFFILISGGNESLVTKGKKTIGFSLIGIAVSLVSYTLIQLVQMFLFSFSK